MPKIAIVEDDAATSDRHRKILEGIPDAVIFQAANYSEAVRLISPGGFDLLVVDIDLGANIPGELEGFNLLRDFGTKMTTIIVTGMPEQNLKTIALQLKAFEFIAKPVHPLDLLNKANHALGFGNSPAGNLPGTFAWPSGLELDRQRPPHLLWKHKPVHLTLTELTIVHALALQPGKTVETRKLSNAMKTGDAKALPSHILGVRKKFLAVDPTFDRIEPDPGLGYLWKPDA